MIKIITIEDIIALKEDYDIEFKKALGKSGRGKLPDDIFSTYSAMSNTQGGNIFLGIEEVDDGIALSGIKDVESIKKELFDSLNNKQKISVNIISDDNVKVYKFEDSYVIHIIVPQATRQQKPIYKGQNPLQGTYIRQYEGDFRCDESSINKMFAEKTEESRDSKVLKNYDFDDIDMGTFYAYRNIFKSNKPDHPWNEQNDLDFLKSIGGYKKDRETGVVGLTIAGLLMFGNSSAIEEYFPFYAVDYQERPRAKTELRWKDRVHLDGTWSGNVFDFYRVVIKKLFSDLKVPFKLELDKRQDDTPVHQSIRESFINAIVHADYSGKSSILIVKRPDMFGFRNPGLMRIPIEIAVKGGESDCRNRILQKMFTLIGYSERAGSGIPKIYSGWNSQNWTKPLIYEKTEIEQTLVELRMINLLDDEVMDELVDLYGDDLKSLSQNEITILATAHLEDGTNHKRVLELLDLHPADVSNILKKLVNELFLISNGVGRGTIYQARGVNDEARGVNDEARGVNENKESLNIYYSLDDLPQNTSNTIIQILEPIKNKQRLKKEIMHETILDICSLGYFSPDLLSKLISKSKDTIKDNLSNLSNSGKLIKLYELSSHPKQAYIKALI
ncbi:MAG: putative DNA binding domain-containing protein [Campylobacterota bacterium]|nr:putative DNA binding domain-containing protein [Campylobacterota bacterium]